MEFNVAAIASIYKKIDGVRVDMSLILVQLTNRLQQRHIQTKLKPGKQVKKYFGSCQIKNDNFLHIKLVCKVEQFSKEN